MGDPAAIRETEGVIADNDVLVSPAQTKEPDLLPVSRASHHLGNASTVDTLRTATSESEEIIVTDQVM